MSGVSISLWFEALGSERGIIVDCLDSDPVKVRQKLYNLRKEAADSDLEDIALVQSPTNPKHLWLVRRPK